MKAQLIITSCLLSLMVPVVGQTPPAPPARPSVVVTPGQTRPGVPNTPPQLPTTAQSIQSQAPMQAPSPSQVPVQNALPSQSDQVPRNAPIQQTLATNAGTATSPSGITNQTPFNNGETPAGANGLDRDDLVATNTGAGLTNQFAAGATNRVLLDEGLTAQDRALLTQVRQALLPEIRRQQVPIHLISQNGVITLMGVVPNAEESQEFATIVQQTPGVVSVVNNLQIAGTGVIEDRGITETDRDLLRHVRSHLRERHQGERAGSFRILSSQGVITLIGFVDSELERQNLVAAVQNTPGVVQVVDRLRVRGESNTDVDASAQITAPAPLAATQAGAASSPGAISSGAARGPWTPLSGVSTNVPGGLTNRPFTTNMDVNPVFPTNSSSAPLRNPPSQ